MTEFDIIIQVHLLVVSILIPVLIAWIHSKTKCLQKIDQRSFRQSQAMIILSKKLDNQNTKYHSDSTSDFTDQIETLLKDEEGNL